MAKILFFCFTPTPKKSDFLSSIYQPHVSMFDFCSSNQVSAVTGSGTTAAGSTEPDTKAHFGVYSISIQEKCTGVIFLYNSVVKLYDALKVCMIRGALLWVTAASRYLLDVTQGSGAKCILLSSELLSKYGHFLLKRQMVTATIPNCGYKKVLHKPVGDITGGSVHLFNVPSMGKPTEEKRPWFVSQ